MRLSRSRERDLLLAVVRDEEQCVVFPSSAYRRADGFLPVHRDGLQELLHRRLFRLVRDASLERAKLERTCDTFGCVNPFHFARRAGLAPGSKTHCVNGHRYDDVGVTPSGHCAVCSTLRQKRRTREGMSQADINRGKTHCPAGHQYDSGNTYWQTTGSGRRRKCRACNRALTLGRRLRSIPSDTTPDFAFAATRHI